MDAPVEPIEIDASHGGQVLRTAVGLSALLGKPIKVLSIRQQKGEGGLKAQHLTAIQTVAKLCNACLEGAKLESKEISFFPQAVQPTQLAVNIGTAGSVMLALQSALLPSLLAEVKLRIVGGTHVAWSPPFEFYSEVLLPRLKQMGCSFESELNALGFFPKGNGSVSFHSKPAKLPLKPINIAELGTLELVKCYSSSASLPREVVRNQCLGAKRGVAKIAPGVDFEEIVDFKEKSSTVGSAVSLFAFYSSGAVLSGTALGEKGKPAINVGKEAADRLVAEINRGKAVGEHLADQLVPFMALAKGYSTVECSVLSEHTLTNIDVCEKLLGVKFDVKGEKKKSAEIFVDGAGFKT